MHSSYHVFGVSQRRFSTRPFLNTKIGSLTISRFNSTNILGTVIPVSVLEVAQPPCIEVCVQAREMQYEWHLWNILVITAKQHSQGGREVIVLPNIAHQNALRSPEEVLLI